MLIKFDQETWDKLMSMNVKLSTSKNREKLAGVTGCFQVTGRSERDPASHQQ